MHYTIKEKKTNKNFISFGIRLRIFKIFIYVGMKKIVVYNYCQKIVNKQVISLFKKKKKLLTPLLLPLFNCF